MKAHTYTCTHHCELRDEMMRCDPTRQRAVEQPRSWHRCLQFARSDTACCGTGGSPVGDERRELDLSLIALRFAYTVRFQVVTCYQ